MATRGALFVARQGQTTLRRSAFTIGELAAVIATTALVLALAYSAYATYLVKREVAEGIAAGSELIAAVTEFYRRHGEVPSERDLAVGDNAASTSTVVGSITVVNGRVDVLYGPLASPAIAGRQISLTPYETVDRHLVWTCGNRAPGPGLEPLGFAAGGRQAVPVETTIERRYLPELCR